MGSQKRNYDDFRCHSNFYVETPPKRHNSHKHGSSRSQNGQWPRSQSRNQSKPQPTSHTNRPQLPPLPEIISTDKPYLATAPFTHASRSEQNNYDRLEFLGDAYLELIATRLIFSRFPHFITGKQAQLRETLVQNSTLAKLALEYGFKERVQTDASVWNARDKVKEKILADVFEAYIAALILADDRDGFKKVEEWLSNCWEAAGMINGAAVERQLGDVNVASGFKENWKDRLTALIAEKDIKIEYVDEPVIKDPMSQQMRVGVYLTGYGYAKKRIGVAEGCGRKEAGMQAAKDAIESNKSLVDRCAEIKRKGIEERRAKREQASSTKTDGIC